jgi:hypothetical protein
MNKETLKLLEEIKKDLKKMPNISSIQTKLTEADKLLEVMGEALKKQIVVTGCLCGHFESCYNCSSDNQAHKNNAKIREILAQYTTYKAGRE